MFEHKRSECLTPLGPLRLRILDCLGADNPRSQTYYSPDPNKNVFAAYGEYVDSLFSHFKNETDEFSQSLFAAARLLKGELIAALVIVDCLPKQPFKTDHGAGYCIVAPLLTLKAVLPLPQDLSDIQTWTAGAPQQTALREWIKAHQNKLHWHEAEAIYK